MENNQILSSGANSKKEAPIQFGIYDPNEKFAQSKSFQLEHLYISWATFQPENLKQDLTRLAINHRTPLLTIEPWPVSGSDYFNSILSGEYDNIMNKICTIIDLSTDSLYLSWGHEMDQTLTKRYPWSGKDPNEFIKSYKYVFDYINKNCAAKIQWVWSPVVKNGSKEYWPGDKYVDIIGIPIYSFPLWDKSYYGHIRSFETTFNEKYSKISVYNKPILIVELGVTGNLDFQEYWLSTAFKSFQNYSLLAGVIYFYSQDTEGAWGSNLPTPDWQVHPEVVTGLVDYYNKK